MAKMLHYPETSGLSSRPYDSYDAACERYYRAYHSKNARLRRLLEDELQSRYASDDLDVDYTHGRNVATVYTVKTS